MSIIPKNSHTSGALVQLIAHETSFHNQFCSEAYVQDCVEINPEISKKNRTLLFKIPAFGDITSKYCYLQFPHLKQTEYVRRHHPLGLYGLIESCTVRSCENIFLHMTGLELAIYYHWMNANKQNDYMIPLPSVSFTHQWSAIQIEIVLCKAFIDKSALQTYMTGSLVNDVLIYRGDDPCIDMRLSSSFLFGPAENRKESLVKTTIRPYNNFFSYMYTRKGEERESIINLKESLRSKPVISQITVVFEKPATKDNIFPAYFSAQNNDDHPISHIYLKLNNLIATTSHPLDWYVTDKLMHNIPIPPSYVYTKTYRPVHPMIIEDKDDTQPCHSLLRLDKFDIPTLHIHWASECPANVRVHIITPCKNYLLTQDSITQVRYSI